MEHTHVGKTYSVNNTIVCAECQPEDTKGTNECFCSCHKPDQVDKSCGNCIRFHQEDE